MCTNAIYVTQCNFLPKVMCLLLENFERWKEAFRAQEKHSFQNGCVGGGVLVGRDFPVCSCCPLIRMSLLLRRLVVKTTDSLMAWHRLPGTRFAGTHFMTEKHECFWKPQIILECQMMTFPHRCLSISKIIWLNRMISETPFCPPITMKRKP